jgi:hypothetical protein
VPRLLDIHKPFDHAGSCENYPHRHPYFGKALPGNVFGLISMAECDALTS